MRTAVRSFLFTDIEGSSRHWEHHPETMPRALAEHDAILHQAISDHGGHIFKTAGDAVCAVFDTPLAAVRAAAAAQYLLHQTRWETFELSQPLAVRMAVQSGAAEERDGDYFGPVLNRVSRLMRAGHGGQVLVSQAAADALAGERLPGVRLRDLGERRLRDIPGAHRVYQLEIAGLPTGFPPLETLEAIPHNLPAALDTCLGRESELATIRHLLLDSPTRLVTLLGPGGIGKTRLALHVAAQSLDSFSGGVWFVDLSGVRDGGMVPAAIARALDARIDHGNDPVAAIVERIGERQVLLVLDNCEQIVDGVARFATALLPLAPDAHLLVTSRAPLHIRGEQRIDVNPLPIEAGDQTGPAVALFLERAQQHRPAFEPTGENRAAILDICRQVDGIPLALELAAARVTVLSPDALRARLSPRLPLLTSSSRDLPERHRTLRNAIAWSYALLTEDEQRVFRRLSVFEGGWSFAAAQAVLDLDELATMEALRSLHDKSLIRRSETGDGEARYAMLETIREFGYDQLTECGERDVARSAHTAFFGQLAKRAFDSLEGGPSQQYWLGVIDRELANVRAAIQSSLDAGDAETAVGLSIDLWYYWSIRGLMEEGQRWLSAGLTVAAEADQALRARALRTLGNLCVERGEVMAAEPLYRESLAICRAIDDDLGIAQSLSLLGMVTGMRGRHEEELAFQTEALARCRALDAPRGIAISLVNLAVWALNRREYEQALDLLDQARAAQERLRDEIGLAFELAYRGHVLRGLGKLDRAAELFEEAERALLRGDALDGVSFARIGRAMVELQRGNRTLAALLADEALAANRERGDMVAVSDALEIVAAISARTGALERGSEALGAASYLRKSTGVPTPAHVRELVDAAHAALDAGLGPEGFAKHWERGWQNEMRATWLKVAPPDLLEFTRGAAQ